MRRTVLLAGVLLCVVALGSDSPKEYGSEAEVSIEGTWELVSSGDGSEQQSPLWVNSRCIQTYQRDKWTYHQKGQLLNEGTYIADSRRKPAFLDEKTTSGFEAGQTRKYIYQLDGDTLRTAFRQGDHLRPNGFDEHGLLIVIYKRVK